jgi:hypothetical protein
MLQVALTVGMSVVGNFDSPVTWTAINSFGLVLQAR